jgi:hypothetical protein
MSPLLAFHLGIRPDHRGRHRDEILRRDDFWLEQTHDYIQWLFPLCEPSRLMPGAPTLTASDLQVFMSDPLLREHMREALRRMLGFYGLAMQGGKVSKSPDWNRRRHDWFTAATHNNLRISRILKSLMLTGLEAEAHAFHACLVELCAREPDCAVPAESQAFWNAALQG